MSTQMSIAHSLMRLMITQKKKLSGKTNFYLGLFRTI